MTILVKDGRAQILKGGMRVGARQRSVGRFGSVGCVCQGKQRLGLIVLGPTGKAKLSGTRLSGLGRLGVMGDTTVQTAPVGSQAGQAASGGTVLVYKATLPIGSGASTPSVTPGGSGWSASGLPAVNAPPAPAPVSGTTTTPNPQAVAALTAAGYGSMVMPRGLSGLGDSSSLSTDAKIAASTAATGLSVGIAAGTLVGAAASSAAATAVLGAAAAGAIGGSFFPIVGTVIGAVIGIIVGLFGAKQKSPPVTQAEIDQATAFLGSYRTIAGTIVGRAFTLSQMQDIAISFAIVKRNPGDVLTQQAISYVWSEYTARLNQLFTAMAAAPAGAQISLPDIKGIPGHPNDFNPNLYYTFTNPGVNAPSDIVGLIFAQLQYAIDCCLYVGTKDVPGLTTATCANLYLAAPYPQFACDLVDWYRSSNPAWDVTGAVVTTQDQNLTLNAPVTTSTAPPPGSVSTFGPAATAAANLPASASASAPVPAPALAAPVSASSPVQSGPMQSLPSPFSSGPVDSTVALPTVATPTVAAPAAAGMDLGSIALIGGAGILALLLLRKK